MTHKSEKEINDNFSIETLLDLEKLKVIFDNFSSVTGFTTGLVSYPSQEVLIATGWRDICTKFHRACPESAKHCKTSNEYLSGQLKDLKSSSIKHCENGLIDGATPIIVKGNHIASLFTGQILFEPPDIEQFKQQAETYGYDIDKYMNALVKVPVVSKEKFEKALEFLSNIAVIHAELGLNNELLAETIEQERETHEKLRESEENLSELNRKLEQIVLERTRELKESYEKYEMITENANDLILVLNESLQIEFCNKKPLQGILGYRVDEVGGQNALGFIHPSDQEIVMSGFIKDNEIKQVVARFRHKDGHYIWMESTGRVFRDKNGGRKDLVIARDISERKKLEQKFRESEERFRLIAENSNDLIRVRNDKYKIEYINEKAHLNLLGYTKDDLIQKTAKSIRHPDEFKQLKTFLRELTKKGEASQECRFMHKNGSYKWFDMRSNLFQDHEGNLKGLIISRDISDKKEAELKLKESEEKYRHLFERSPNKNLLIDSYGTITSANSPFLTYFGYNRDELIGKDFRNVEKFDPKNLVFFQKIFEDVLSKGVFEPFEFQAYDIYNEEKWMEIRAFLIEIGDRKMVQVIMQDVDERKRAEIALKESEERYRLIIENSGDVIWSTDMNLNLTYVSPNSPKILGYTIEESMSFPIDVRVTPESMKKMANILKEEFKLERKKDKDLTRSRTYETEQIHKNGSIIPVEITFTFLRDADGKATGIIGISRDITERKNAEKRLKESEEMFSKAFHKNSTLMALSTTEDGQYIDVNESFLNKLGYRREEVIGQTSSELNIWTEFDERDIIIQELRDKGSVMDIEIPIRAKNGDIRYGLFTADLIEIKGNPLLLTLMTDITDRKIAEQKIKESEKIYRKAYEQANFYKELLAHDIRNILQVVNSSAELISFDLNGPESPINISSLSDVIKTQVKRGSKLIHNVHKLSEIDEAEISIVEIEALHLLEHAFNSVKRSYQEKNIDIQLDSAGKECYVLANDLLEDVFENLLINAVKYNNSETIELSIKISKLLRDKEPFVKMEFMDNGIGVDNRRKKLIFQRGNREYKGTKGMGLGLSLVTKILESYNGEIWVEDRVKGDHSKGSNFVILIPEAKIS